MRRRTPGDHPRSRGVYDAARAWTSRREGSSPLARGLRCTGEHVRGLLRIIPARAGFTSPGTGAIPKSRDHPRSRGVYMNCAILRGRIFGSSPLARGLRRASRRRGAMTRIIPARAGFTTAPGCPSRSAWDHPRSRGVYEPPRRPVLPCLGSSPLARGLQIAPAPSLIDGRIIPARAGFTWPSCAGAWGRSDHPRSRGVYVVDTSWPVVPAGSSPLARGLRGGWSAGGRRCGDHPRSRGVYVAVSFEKMMAAGSSPLARGLPNKPVKALGCSRIIPARAGFTGQGDSAAAIGADHPRSRGGYTGRSWRRWTTPGSSPLARGLRARLREELAADRIIPARAGFTAEAG